MKILNKNSTKQMIIKKTAVVMLLKWISSRKIFKNTDQHVLSLGNKTNIL